MDMDNMAHWRNFQRDADQLARMVPLSHRQPTSRQYAKALLDTTRRNRDGFISRQTWKTHTTMLLARVEAAGKPHRVRLYLRQEGVR